MKVWGVPEEAIREIAREAGLSIRGGVVAPVGNALRFDLRLHDRGPLGIYRFQKLDVSGTPTGSVCWHGYREFLFALFRREERASVRIGPTVVYYGRPDFLERYRDTMPGERRCVCNRLHPPIHDPNIEPVNTLTATFDAATEVFRGIQDAIVSGSLPTTTVPAQFITTTGTGPAQFVTYDPAQFDPGDPARFVPLDEDAQLYPVTDDQSESEPPF